MTVVGDGIGRKSQAMDMARTACPVEEDAGRIHKTSSCNSERVDVLTGRLPRRSHDYYTFGVDVINSGIGTTIMSPPQTAPGEFGTHVGQNLSLSRPEDSFIRFSGASRQ